MNFEIAIETKKSLMICFAVLISMNMFSQNIVSGTLWKAETVYDTLGNAYPNEKIQSFMYFDNESSISTLVINEKINNENGEIIISYLVDGHNLEEKSDIEYKVKELSIDNFKFVSKDSIYYKKRRYNVGFKQVKVKQSLITEVQLMNFLLSSSVRNYYENGESLNQIHTYKDNGKKVIQVVGSDSSWESDFRVFSFEGYLFLKGITSAPMIIETLEDNKIQGKEADYRFESKIIEIRKEKL